MVRMLDWIREKMTGQGRPEKIEPLEFVKEVQDMVLLRKIFSIKI